MAVTSRTGLRGSAPSSENVLIVEDDVFFADDWRKHVHVVRDFVNNEQEESWECLFLGCTPRRSLKTRVSHLSLLRTSLPTGTTCTRSAI